MISALFESVILFVTKPVAFVRDVVVGVFYWSTRIFGVSVALVETLTGKGK